MNSRRRHVQKPRARHWAVSADESQQSYEGYAKRTMKRALAATRLRHAHRLANTVGTEFQNGDEKPFQTADKVEQKINRNLLHLLEN
jgi:hypothetical protein